VFTTILAFLSRLVLFCHTLVEHALAGNCEQRLCLYVVEPHAALVEARRGRNPGREEWSYPGNVALTFGAEGLLSL